MKTAFLITLCLLGSTAIAEVVVQNNRVYEIESDTFQLEGSTVEGILEKAQECFARELRNESIVLSDSGDQLGIFSQRDSSKTAVASSGTDITVLPDSVIATQNVDFRHMGVKRNVRSRVELQAREGRYRITHMNVEHAQYSTGSISNDGYGPVHTGWGAGSKPAIQALENVTSELADCIQADPSDEEW